MIARLWRGWAASTEAADQYEAFLRTEFLPSAHAIEGYRGAAVLRRAVGGEVEFTTITRFDTIAAIRTFAGEDAEAAHVAPRGRELLSHFEDRCQHFDMVIEDGPLGAV
jgi:antibiotic biosynthesis monooxygenase (ABM) superfamily enzyme